MSNEGRTKDAAVVSLGPPPDWSPLPIRQLWELQDALFRDLVGSLPDKRSRTRASLAFIDGLATGIKRCTSQVATMVGRRFPPETEAMLADETYQLLPSGRVRRRTYRPPADGNILFAFNTMAELVQSDRRYSANTPGWSRLQQAIKIRDRVTHPKIATDLEVSDADDSVVTEAREWFSDRVHELLLDAAAWSLARLRRLKTIRKRDAKTSAEPPAEVSMQELVPIRNWLRAATQEELAKLGAVFEKSMERE